MRIEETDKAGVGDNGAKTNNKVRKSLPNVRVAVPKVGSLRPLRGEKKKGRDMVWNQREIFNVPINVLILKDTKGRMAQTPDGVLGD